MLTTSATLLLLVSSSTMRLRHEKCPSLTTDNLLYHNDKLGKSQEDYSPNSQQKMLEIPESETDD